jgi:endonuclease/exonuclease/phosphatase (EEP) superfamily protein YafD
MTEVPDTSAPGTADSGARRWPWWLVASLGLGSAVSFSGPVGASQWWRLELLSHFRVQWIWACLFAAALLGVAKQLWPAVAAVGLASVHALAVAPVYVAPEAAPTTGEPLRIVFANVHTQNRAHDRVVGWLRREDADYVVLAEVDDRWMAALEPLSPRYPNVVARPRQDNFGIALLSRHALDSRIESIGGDDTPPTIVAHDAARGITIVGTHPVPPVTATYMEQRDRQLQALAEALTAIESPIVVVGDLNATPWSPAFSLLADGASLHDSRQGFGVHATWPAEYPAFLRIPIDHGLGTKEVAFRARRIGDDVGSDHLGLVIDFDIAR